MYLNNEITEKDGMQKTCSTTGIDVKSLTYLTKIIFWRRRRPFIKLKL